MPTQVVPAQPSTNASSGFTQFWEDVKAIAAPYWYPTEPGERARTYASYISTTRNLGVSAIFST